MNKTDKNISLLEETISHLKSNGFSVKDDSLKKSMIEKLSTELEIKPEDILSSGIARKMFEEPKMNSEDILNGSIARKMFEEPKMNSEDILNGSIARKMFTESKPNLYNTILKKLKKIISSFKEYFSSPSKKEVFYDALDNNNEEKSLFTEQTVVSSQKAQSEDEIFYDALDNNFEIKEESVSNDPSAVIPRKMEISSIEPVHDFRNHKVGLAIAG